MNQQKPGRVLRKDGAFREENGSLGNTTAGNATPHNPETKPTHLQIILISQQQLNYFSTQHT